MVQIALVLIDEVHLLNDSRGSALEAGAIGRIKMVSQKQEMQQVTSLLGPALLIFRSIRMAIDWVS